MPHYKKTLLFFLILFQNILIYTFLNNTYYIHLLYILREREREVLFNTFCFSLLCIYSTISFVWVTYLVWCKSTSVFVTFLTFRLIVGTRIDTYICMTCAIVSFITILFKLRDIITATLKTLLSWMRFTPEFRFRSISWEQTDWIWPNFINAYILKRSRQIGFCHFLQICNRVMALDRHQNFVSNV